MRRVTPVGAGALWVLLVLGILYLLFALFFVHDLVYKAVFCAVALIAVAITANDLYCDARDKGKRRNGAP